MLCNLFVEHSIGQSCFTPLVALYSVFEVFRLKAWVRRQRMCSLRVDFDHRGKMTAAQSSVSLTSSFLISVATRDENMLILTQTQASVSGILDMSTERHPWVPVHENAASQCSRGTMGHRALYFQTRTCSFLSCLACALLTCLLGAVFGAADPRDKSHAVDRSQGACPWSI